ncbi:MAG TPA: phage major capsid protein [Bacilli bacterium]|jgi:HK97 family phage major capsid protein|nr:phage major capsid protein [Bacilli bacterium]HOD61455.1 phage major capsid protein [Bacilli bacterium]HOH58557.1 phage major capsid protein [Bacilli bacterium]HOR17406.1 phage major capsid protein [Bacilli bacterium]
MNLEKRKQEIKVRLNEIKGLTGVEATLEVLEDLEKEVDELKEEEETIDRKLAIQRKAVINPIQIERTDQVNKEELEKRGAMLKEARVIQVSSEEILLPEHTAPNIAAYPFAQVSSLVDRVKVVNLTGGETYKKSFIKGNGIAGLTAEGAAYSETEPDFGYLTITKVKVTAYTEITEELEKLPSLPYQAEVIKNINIALKKKISEQILKGPGTSNTFTGIFSDQAVALADSTPLEISAITDSTLDDIVFAYGGDEEIEGGAYLILNKNDLRAFAGLRTPEGRKVHTIDYINSTIDGIPYIINSHCKALTDTNTSEGEYVMAYGGLHNYEVPIFSPVEIGKSTDYKFKDGIISYKASVFTGGNVVGYNGFLRIKKKA